MQSMTGGTSLSRVLISFLLLRTLAARAGPGVNLTVYFCDMGSQTVTMQDLPAMAALALPELTRPSILVFGAMVPLMFSNSSNRQVSTAELTLSILGGLRFHFPMSSDSAPAHR